MRQGELSWRDRGRLWMRLGIRMILVLLIVLALRYLVPPLLGLLMPFALALVVAWVLNPLVKSLQKRLGLSRGVLSLLLILLAFAVAGGILFGLGHSLVSEISSLIDNWEGIWESLQGGILTIGEELDKFLAYLPGTHRAHASLYLRRGDLSAAPCAQARGYQEGHPNFRVARRYRYGPKRSRAYSSHRHSYGLSRRMLRFEERKALRQIYG